MIINHNLGAMNAMRQMGDNQNNMSNSMEKLSSGLRINRAGDDAAGLAISEKMRGQIRGLEQANRNSQDGISMIQTAEGALNETHSILQRMRELAVQSSNDTNVGADRNEIQKEMNQLTSEINRIGNTTNFNTQNLLDGGKAVEGAASVTDASTTGTPGEYTFDVSTALGDGDSLTYGGVTIAAADDGSADVTSGGSSTATTQAAEIKTALESDSNFNDKYSITDNNDGSLTINEKTASGDAAPVLDTTSVTTGTVTSSEDTPSDATTGGVEISTVSLDQALVEGESIEINGVKIEAGSGKDIDTDTATTAIDQATAIKTALDNDGDFSSKFSVTDNGDGTLDITTTGAATGETATAKVSNGGFEANFQTGANQGQSMTISVADMRSVALGISGETQGATADGMGEEAAGAVFTSTSNVSDGISSSNSEYALDVSTHENASKAVETINQAIEGVSAQRSELGAYQNRLEHTINNLGTSAENLQAAESRVRDVDMAKEMMEMTKNNILSQASQSMLAQANQQPQSVLQLLQ